jgi:hypothetical protein
LLAWKEEEGDISQVLCVSFGIWEHCQLAVSREMDLGPTIAEN